MLVGFPSQRIQQSGLRKGDREAGGARRGFLLPALHAVLRASLPGSLWLQPPASLGPSRSNLITPPHDLAAATGRHPRLLSSDGPDLFPSLPWPSRQYLFPEGILSLQPKVPFLSFSLRYPCNNFSFLNSLHRN